MLPVCICYILHLPTEKRIRSLRGWEELMVAPGLKHLFRSSCILCLTRGPRLALPDGLAHAASAEPVSISKII